MLLSRGILKGAGLLWSLKQAVYGGAPPDASESPSLKIQYSTLLWYKQCYCHNLFRSEDRPLPIEPERHAW